MSSNDISDAKTPEKETALIKPDSNGVKSPARDERATETVPGMSRSKVAVVMSALGLAVFVAAIDMTVITTALTTITAEMGATESDYTWIGSVYMLASAAITPVSGTFSDIFGRKPIILASNILFFVGSIICALAVDVKMLITGRVVQGLGGGGILTLVNICVGDLFSVRDRGLYFGIISLIWALASALGPVVGGAFAEYVTWRWCFYINLPITGFSLIAILLFLDIHNPKTPIIAGIKAIDWLGIILLVGATVAFLLGLNFGGTTFAWNSATVICLIIFGALIFVLFVFWEWRGASNPITPPRIFTNLSNGAALALCFIHGFVYISDAYFLPEYFQMVLGASPLLSGVYLFPSAITLSFAAASTGIFMEKTGKFIPAIWLGTLFLILGHGIYTDLPYYASWARVIMFQIICAFGIGSLFQSPLIAIHSNVEPQDVASATALYGFLRQVATAVSVVVGGVILQNELRIRLAPYDSTLPPEIVTQLHGGDITAARAAILALPSLEKSEVRMLYTSSMQSVWTFYTAVAAVAIVPAALIQAKFLNRDHQIVKTGLPQRVVKEEIEERATDPV